MPTFVSYPGTNPVTIVPTLTAGYGLWPVPQEGSGGMTRSSGNIFTMAENLADRTNALGWRVFYLNVIEGVPSGHDIWTSAIYTQNQWRFTGASASTGSWIFTGSVGLQSGTTFDVGDPLSSPGTEKIKVWPGRFVTFAGTSGHPATLSMGQYDVFTTIGKVQIGTSPAATADPGDNNVLTGPNIPKAWGNIFTDGLGAVSIGDGYNIASVAIAGSHDHIVVTFARAFANTFYAPCGNAYVSTFGYPLKFTMTSATVMNIFLPDGSSPYVDLSAQVAAITFQVMGRQ